MFDIRDLPRPVLVAPMAGGPSTPELAGAGSAAGGLGFIAAGYLSAEELAGQITAVDALTTGPIGVNLFVPQPSVADQAEIVDYAAALRAEERRYSAMVGEARFDDDQFSAKLAVVLDLRPELVSFTFGLPTSDECAQLRRAGIATAGTVTTLSEARAAVACGLDVLVAQGPKAGGHRATFDPAAHPASEPLDRLLGAVKAGFDVPVIAAGGLVTGYDIARMIDAGAVAAQLGTAFLLADEAGSNPVHRAALQSPRFTETAVTKAFSGRYARGLRNRFIDEHEAEAPLGYPEVHYLTGPLRRAAVRAGDPEGTNLWAGTGFRAISASPVAEIIDGLT